MEVKNKKLAYDTPRIEKIELHADDVILTSGAGDVGRGRGGGGGCDGVPGHENQRTFSNGRNSGC